MKKIVIIGVYFGKFPGNFDLFLKSCKFNPTINFKIFTNQKITIEEKNIEFINIEFEEFNNLMKKKMGKEFNISYPYKCCDFKPAYGTICEDYIKEYDFWGHCDFDLIFGDIRKFLTDDILNKYDKILPLGHLSFYRNVKKVNSRYKDNGSLVGNYKEVYTNPNNVAFDEDGGITRIYYENKYPFYDKRVFADISTIWKRFKLARKDKNYKFQVFYWESGHIYRAYKVKNKINIDEFMYIHFKQRKYLKSYINNENCNSFYLSDKGFFEKDKKNVTMNDIKLYNNYPGFVIEVCEKMKSKLRTTIKKIKKGFKVIIKK